LAQTACHKLELCEKNQLDKSKGLPLASCQKTVIFLGCCIFLAGTVFKCSAWRQSMLYFSHEITMHTRKDILRTFQERRGINQCIFQSFSLAKRSKWIFAKISDLKNIKWF